MGTRECRGRCHQVAFALGDKDASDSRGNIVGVAVELIGHQTSQRAGNVLARKRMVSARRQHDAVVALAANDGRRSRLHVIAARHELNAHAGIPKSRHQRIAKRIAPDRANHARARTHARGGDGLVSALATGVGDKTAAADGLARARHALARHRKVHVHAAEHRNDAAICHGNLLVCGPYAHRRPSIVRSRTSITLVHFDVNARLRLRQQQAFTGAGSYNEYVLIILVIG